MIRMQNDTLIFDAQDLTILFNAYGIDVPEDADVAVSLTCGDSLHTFPIEEVCLIIKMSREDAVNALESGSPQVLSMLG